MKMTPRLKAIAEKVPKGASLADIGTDHAYLPIYLIEHQVISRAVGVEVAKHPLANARQQVQQANLEQVIDLRQGYGLEALSPGEAEAVVLAGMGGKTIISILGKSPEVLSRLHRLILQPMNDAAEVRRWLLGSSWQIVDEDLVREGKMFYFIIVAEPAVGKVSPGYSELEMEIGPLLVRGRHPLLGEYLEVLIARGEEAISKMRKSGRIEIREREAMTARRVEELKALAGGMG